MKTPRAAPGITTRKMAFPFDGKIPRHWFAGSQLGTHMANALNLIFPAGERFFVRSVHHFLAEMERDDPELARDIRAFFSQEGHHARAHEKFFDVLRGQGYDIEGFLRRYTRFIEKVEPRFSPVLRLSVTAALEHYTAAFAQDALTQPIFSELHPVMRDLLQWHAAEEIEHKAVAFDVLERVDGRYRTRMTGMALASVLFVSFWVMGTVMMFRQDRPGVRGTIAELLRVQQRGGLANGNMLRPLLAYLRRDFHPNDQSHDRELATAALERLTAAYGDESQMFDRLQPA